jgi:hypothetical protein
MLNIDRLDLPHNLPYIVLGGAGVAAFAQAPGPVLAGAVAASFIHYGPGHVTAFILEEGKKASTPFFTGLSAMSLVFALTNISVETVSNTLRSPIQALAFGVANYTLGHVLIHYGSGRVAAAVKPIAEKVAKVALISVGVIGLSGISLYLFVRIMVLFIYAVNFISLSALEHSGFIKPRGED